MTEFSDKKKTLSDFNEAIYQILRLHDLWCKCNQCSQNGNHLRWKWILDNIWRELSADAIASDKKNKKDETKYSYQFKIFNQKIIRSKGPLQLYNALQEKEIFLRCLQEDVGKGGKKSDHFDNIMV